MSGMSGWMLVAAAVVIVLNLVATTRILRAVAFSPSQQLVQLMLTWLLPVMGATICIAFARSQAIGDARERERLDPYACSDGASGDGYPALSGDGACGSAFGGDGCGGGGDGGGGD
ncbi:hypothetical protein [Marilutibacter chinensis]|uniref:Uncharacterized protein n=1 Tax=Marilutibacter chinensis TaxID=2912247 RepID=A0ABS9HWU3_9GAMM|nr:hypothetical protein [Lysobacter chinensis]MCF7222768.1 hypothetical protein [Lysobacter chinensis]